MAVLKQRWEQVKQKERELKGSFVHFDKFLQVGGDCWGQGEAGHWVTKSQPCRGQTRTEILKLGLPIQGIVGGTHGMMHVSF